MSFCKYSFKLIWTIHCHWPDLTPCFPRQKICYFILRKLLTRHSCWQCSRIFLTKEHLSIKVPLRFSLFFFSIALVWTVKCFSFSPRTNKHIWWLFTRFKTLETFQSIWHPFKLAAIKPNANRAGFREAVSINAQSVCSHRHSLCWLIYFILKGLSICITRTGLKKVCDFVSACV